LAVTLPANFIDNHNASILFSDCCLRSVASLLRLPLRSAFPALFLYPGSRPVWEAKPLGDLARLEALFYKFKSRAAALFLESFRQFAACSSAGCISGNGPHFYHAHAGETARAVRQSCPVRILTARLRCWNISRKQLGFIRS